MHNTSTVTAAEKAELLAIFDTPPAAAPSRRHKPGMLAHKIHGWQEERRRALHLMRASRESALARREYVHADAYLWAAMDLEDTLRARASDAIAEGCLMSRAHEELPQ